MARQGIGLFSQATNDKMRGFNLKLHLAPHLTAWSPLGLIGISVDTSPARARFEVSPYSVGFSSG